MQKSFTEFCLTNNFEEREVAAGFIDGEVLDYLKTTFAK
jgi:hypothetical protein